MGHNEKNRLLFSVNAFYSEIYDKNKERDPSCWHAFPPNCEFMCAFFYVCFFFFHFILIFFFIGYNSKFMNNSIGKNRPTIFGFEHKQCIIMNTHNTIEHLLNNLCAIEILSNRII